MEADWLNRSFKKLIGDLPNLDIYKLLNDEVHFAEDCENNYQGWPWAVSSGKITLDHYFTVVVDYKKHKFDNEKLIEKCKNNTYN